MAIADGDSALHCTVTRHLTVDVREVEAAHASDAVAAEAVVVER